MKFILALIGGTLLITSGYFFGNYSASNIRVKREVKLCDSFVFDSTFCGSVRTNDLLIRIALIDFLCSGGDHPPSNSSARVLLLHLRNRSSPDEIKLFFNKELNDVESITKENSIFRNKDRAVLMISGTTNLVDKNYTGLSQCSDFIDFIEKKFSDYVFSYD